MPAKEKVQLSAALSSHTEGVVIITAEFGNGVKRDFNLAPNHPLYQEFAIHGVGQKIRQQVAPFKEVEKQIEKVDALFAAFHQGKWSSSRSTEGGGEKNLLVSALVHRYGRSPEDARAFVSTLSKKEQADMRKLPEIASAIVELNAAKEVDEASSLLLSLFIAGNGDESTELAESESEQ